MENIKRVEWTMDDLFNQFRTISLVTSPATELETLLFSKDNENIIKFKTTDDEKRVITGCAMRPNIDIERLDDDGNKYYGYFTIEAVRMAAELFFKSGNNFFQKINLEHDKSKELEDVYVFESWIVEDPNIDKAKALGFSDIRKDDWFVSMKVENEMVWNNYLKSGKIKGYSVEIKPSITVVNDDEVKFAKIQEILLTNEDDELKFAKILDILK